MLGWEWTEWRWVGVDYLWPLLVNFTRWRDAGWLIIDLLWLALGVFTWVRMSAVFAKNFMLYNNREHVEYVSYDVHGTWCGVSLVAIFVFGALGEMYSPTSATFSAT